jgi:hypothetical protein
MEDIMSDQRMEIYTNAKRARVEAEKWNALPEGKKYQNSTFSISPAHCKKPMLCRAGQQSCGGHNYWETEEPFNTAILDCIVAEWETLYPKVLAILKEKERMALKNCQAFIDEMQQAIDTA